MLSHGTHLSIFFAQTKLWQAENMSDCAHSMTFLPISFLRICVLLVICTHDPFVQFNVLPSKIHFFTTDLILLIEISNIFKNENYRQINNNDNDNNS